jgi:hypothetical protein
MKDINMKNIKMENMFTSMWSLNDWVSVYSATPNLKATDLIKFE